MFNIGDICSADRDFQRRDGGPGSGNWGHVGRPGHRGAVEAVVAPLTD